MEDPTLRPVTSRWHWQHSGDHYSSAGGALAIGNASGRVFVRGASVAVLGCCLSSLLIFSGNRPWNCIFMSSLYVVFLALFIAVLIMSVSSLVFEI